MTHANPAPGRAPRWLLLLIAQLCALGCLVAQDDIVSVPEPERVPWTTSRVRGTSEPPLPYRSELAFPRLTFQLPVTLATAPGSSLWFVVQVYGRVFSFPSGAGGCEPPDLFADLRAVFPNLTQAYGLAFHPQYPRKPYVYICCILNEENGSAIVRFDVDPGEPPRILPESRRDIYRWPGGGHNGCSVKFGPDGYLYFSTGDGTGPNPPDRLRAGQDLSNAMSTIVRIDVDRPDAGLRYGVPPDNPFVGLDGALPEIWAYGFRNVWKMSFDRLSGDLWAGDVGWDTWELVYRVQRGGNYGWSIMEGSQAVHPAETRGPTPILPPITQHDHSEARSITGGFVYRGKLYPELFGAYVYGDYSTGKVWALWSENGRATRRIELANTPYQIVGWGEAPDGELLFLDYGRTHQIYRLVPNDVSDHSQRFPRRLSESGLFASVAEHRLASGVIPYVVNAPYWADGHVAERFLALPGAARIGGSLKGAWKFPEGTVAARTVSAPLAGGRPARRIETQILHLHGTVWNPYTYVWNEAQDDAVLAPAEGVAAGSVDENPAGGTPRSFLRVPSRSECKMCHTRKLGSVLGLNVRQANVVRSIDGDRSRSQLEDWYELGILEQRPSAELLSSPRLVNPHLVSNDIDRRARSYLHANCAHCHRPGGGGNSSIHLDFSVPLEGTKTVDQRPTQGDFQLADSKILSPGRPYESVLFYRLCKSGPGRMPHIGSSEADTSGLQLIHDWILALPGESARTPSEATVVFENANDRLATTSGALEIAWRLRTEPLDGSTRDSVLHLALPQPPQIRDLFEAMLPAEERTTRLGPGFAEELVLKLAGDVSRGRTVYWYTSGMQCQSCHRVELQGGDLGPDLSAVGGKYDRRALLRSLTRPSETVADEYRAYTLLTRQGRLETGRLVRRDDSSVLLRTADGNAAELPTTDVLELAPADKSLMPEELLQALTAQQAADLLAYLVSLRGSVDKSD